MTNNDFDDKFNEIYDILAEYVQNDDLLNFAIDLQGKSEKAFDNLCRWKFGETLEQFLEDVQEYEQQEINFKEF